jgi:hypothetical protein
LRRRFEEQTGGAAKLKTQDQIELEAILGDFVSILPEVYNASFLHRKNPVFA